VGSVFGPVRFLLPVCRLSWFLYTCTFFVTFFSATIDGRNLIFGHKLHIGTPYRGKHFWTYQSDSYFLFADFVDFYTHWTYIICSFFVTFFSATIDGRNLIFGHKLHIGTPYRGKSFWIHQIPTSCLPILLIFIHIEHTFLYIPIFSRIFLSNYWWQKSDIWSQASYRYPISWEAFFDLSDSYFLFAEERGYHKWVLAHSSSCLNRTLFKLNRPQKEIFLNVRSTILHSDAFLGFNPKSKLCHENDVFISFSGEK
jgi:hypothetical protein